MCKKSNERKNQRVLTEGCERGQHKKPEHVCSLLKLSAPETSDHYCFIARGPSLLIACVSCSITAHVHLGPSHSYHPGGHRAGFIHGIADFATLSIFFFHHLCMPLQSDMRLSYTAISFYSYPTLIMLYRRCFHVNQNLCKNRNRNTKKRLRELFKCNYELHRYWKLIAFTGDQMESRCG